MKVLIVDDSVVYRSAIKSALTGSGQDYEIDIAANGKIAIDKLKMKEYDIVTLDLEMPVMDGLETIKAIREFNNKVPVIIFSAQNVNAANKTLHALEIGANDFVKKIEGGSNLDENIKMIQQELLPRFKALAGRIKGATGVNVKEPVVEKIISTPVREKNFLQVCDFYPSILCIASSTGGPDVLKKIFSDLEKLPIPVLIVQHMPPVFTTQLAKGLDQISKMTVKEAAVGDIIEPGVAYLVPGDFHMVIEKKNDKYQINLNQDPKVCYVRPAADVTFQSVAENFTGKVLGVILTGMGNDGANGSGMLKNKDCRILIQDEDSSVVWGMPKAVYEKGFYDIQLTPSDIVKAINRMTLR